MSKLIVSGTMDKYPNLQIIICHAGGAFPYVVGRLDRGGGGGRLKQPVHAYLRRFYFDNLAWYPLTLKYLIDLVGSDRVVLGTDNMGGTNPGGGGGGRGGQQLGRRRKSRRRRKCTRRRKCRGRCKRGHCSRRTGLRPSFGDRSVGSHGRGPRPDPAGKSDETLQAVGLYFPKASTTADPLSGGRGQWTASLWFSEALTATFSSASGFFAIRRIAVS